MKHRNQQLLTQKMKRDALYINKNKQGRSYYSTVSIFQNTAQAMIWKTMLRIDSALDSMPGTVPLTLYVFIHLIFRTSLRDGSIIIFIL